MRLLLVEDHVPLADELTASLTRQGYAVDWLADGRDAAYQGASEPYDLIILDLGLPGKPGLEVLQEWRAGGLATPVLVLTARGSCAERIEGLKAGADDYLTKPFDVAELMDAIGEGEITDPLADFTVGRFRVHLVQEGERYGATGGFVYGKALSNGSFGIPINDCQLYGHGLPLVEFYDVSQDPAKFPEGQFVTRYYMSTLLGMDSIGDSIGEMSAFGLDGGVPDWTIRGDDL
mgnify:CR=1 FL=1